MIRTLPTSFLRTAAVLMVLDAGLFAADATVVRESAREIPVAYDVDVVVLGGGTGAVSAAVAAAEAGARVFLAAPYPYLGDDMTATLRLSLEEGEVPTAPLAKAIFNDPVDTAIELPRKRLPLSYASSIPSSVRHRDTDPPSRLTNGVWGDASQESVQYDGSVTIDADLGKAEEIDAVRVVVYRRDETTSGGGGFNVESVVVSVSEDKQSWKPVAELAGELGPSQGLSILTAPVEATTRYVRFVLKKPPQCDRILLGEIEVLGAADEKAATLPQPPRPLHVKKTLEDALLDAGVEFLFSCLPTDVLRDAGGAPAGIVMANRAGRQAVLARVIVDATDRGTVARLAGARFRDYPAGTHTFRRMVVGGDPVELENGSARVIPPGFMAYACVCGFPGWCEICIGDSPLRGHAARYGNRRGPVLQGSDRFFKTIEYTLDIAMPDGSFASFAAADQLARSLTYHSDQRVTADRLFQVPPDAMHGRQSVAGDGLAVEALPLDAFRPEGVNRLYLLGGAADISRARAAQLMRPLDLIDMGARIGTAAAEEATIAGKPAGVRLPGEVAAASTAAGEVCETLVGVRPVQKLPTIPQEARNLPVLGRYDVVVIGGGTGGAPAGIGAAREGAKVLVVEYLHMLGGVGTAGYISRYHSGNRGGFTATIPGGNSWWPEQRAQWWRQTLLDDGADIWFGAIGCGAVVEGDRVVGAVVATPQGRGVVLADVVIDSTGNADVAAAADARTDYTDAREFGMQGTGLPPRRLGAAYTNTDFTIVDETDMVDLWHTFVYSKQKYPEAFDQGQLVDTRERRRIVGDFSMTILDQAIGRTYGDTISQARSDYDSHGYTVDPYLMLETKPMGGAFLVNIPYRCLLPKGLEGLLVTGLGISMHRDAVPLVRMQACIQNQGYAAGLAAAIASRAGSPLRAIDIRTVQRKLIGMGYLPEEVLGQGDSLPMSSEEIARAVREAPENYRAAAIVTLHREESLPMLREAYESSEGRQRYVYAVMLAMLFGDATGVDPILQRVRIAEQWDEGWDYWGMGQSGDALSHLDKAVVALGMAAAREAVPAILKLAALLDSQSAFSHHRAVAMALERLGDRAAAPVLAALLGRPGMSGHVHDTIAAAKAHDAEYARYVNAVHSRRDSLRELFLARALYRLGDHEGIGETTLRAYASDLRGHLARHARAVLDQREIGR
ncbi:MAG: FAD-dependent oxidoreductase [Rhodopirellula sp.]|nr:FAD-dependent oxidoreductase [Rhodopirellula sp.]